MKNKYLSALVYFIYGLLIAVGPHLWFKVCTSEASMMKCYWTSRALIGVGGLFIFLGILGLFVKDRYNQVLLSVFGFAAAVLALSFPLYLIGGCGNSRMPCRTTAFPVIYLLNGLLLFYIAGNSIYLGKKLKKISGDRIDEEKE